MNYLERQAMTTLKKNIMKAMRLATPKDTGNLAYSSMKGYISQNGIKVIYDGKRAPYGKILNQTMYRRVKTGNYVRYKKNKHFGWNNRAQMNGVQVVMEYFGKKKQKRYDTKQEYRFPLDSNAGKQARHQQYMKTLNNSAIQRYERENKV